jgi:4a-hydroxytetrahydrobiopterin dehydratase
MQQNKSQGRMNESIEFILLQDPRPQQSWEATMPDDIAQKTCTPCRGGVPPLTSEQAAGYLPQVPGWELRDAARWLTRSFKFANFKEAIGFVDSVGRAAEEEGHHPDICFGWGYATVSLQTHKIKGLHENDFIMAAKFNQLLAG